MSISLAKGQKISLEKVAQDAGIQGGLSRILVGLGWDISRFDSGSDFDLDASVFLCDANGKVVKESNFIFYKNTTAPGVEHMGDNRTGAGDGDDEVIKIDLNSVESDVAKIAVTVTIYKSKDRHQNFGMVENSYVRVVDEATGTELLRYDLGEDYSIETAIVVAEIYRNNGEWKFSAVGSGFSDEHFSEGLAALCNHYGLSVG